MLEKPTFFNERESNIDTAQIMAKPINKFVNQGIISAKEASKLDPDKLDEFMCRSADDIINLPEIIPEENKAKLRTMFGLNLNEFDKPIDQDKRNTEIQETVKEMRDYLFDFQKEFSFIKGMILCGSKMVVDKMPRPDSDVDAVMILDEGYETSHNVPGGQELVQKMVKFTDKNKTKSGAEVSLDDFYTMSALQKELESKTAQPGKGKLIWGFNPKAIYYIGNDLKFGGAELGEKEVNQFLNLNLNSSETKELKRQMIARTKERILKESNETPESREQRKNFESFKDSYLEVIMDSNISDTFKVLLRQPDLLLVLSKLKPMTELHFQKDTVERWEKAGLWNEGDLNKFQALLRDKFKLSIVSEHREGKDAFFRVFDEQQIKAKIKEFPDLLPWDDQKDDLQSWWDKNLQAGKKWDYLLGICQGFPKSAIEFYLTSGSTLEGAKQQTISKYGEDYGVPPGELAPDVIYREQMKEVFFERLKNDQEIQQEFEKNHEIKDKMTQIIKEVRKKYQM